MSLLSWKSISSASFPPGFSVAQKALCYLEDSTFWMYGETSDGYLLVGLNRSDHRWWEIGWSRFWLTRNDVKWVLPKLHAGIAQPTW